MRRHVKLRPKQVVALLAVATLAACAEDASGPQFANEPAPTRPPTLAASLATPVLRPTEPGIATPASLGDLLASRGSPPRIYVTADDSVWNVSGLGQAKQVFALPPGSELVDLDPSPNAGQVALLLASGPAATEDNIVVVDSEGRIVARSNGLGVGTATPHAGAAMAAETIDWSPQGDRILVSLSDGRILTFDPDLGAEQTLVRAAQDGERVLDPAWSPTGESIAFIAVSEEGRERSLRVIDVNGNGVVGIVPAAQDRAVVEFAWMPDGRSLIFTEGGQPGGAVTGIDLWRIQTDGTGRELVASAGTVAPVARLTLARPSPDGRSVAYVALVPGPDGPVFDSLWVRDLASGVGFRADLPDVREVDALWWTDAGLAIEGRAAPFGGKRASAKTLWLVDRDGTVRGLWEAPIPVGTPVSATPGATPAGG